MWPQLTPLILLLLPISSYADDLSWQRIQCTPLANLDASIHFCTENPRAKNAADACTAELDRAWSDAAKDIAILSGGVDSTQRLNLGRSQEKYDSAVERLRILINITKRNTNLIAQYPTVMVDSPIMDTWSDSLPCYREVYDQVQSTVTRLDRKVAQARTVLASTTKLRAALGRLARGVGAGAISPSVAHGVETISATPRAPSSAEAPTVLSDITGAKKEPDLN